MKQYIERISGEAIQACNADAGSVCDHCGECNGKSYFELLEDYLVASRAAGFSSLH